MVFPILPEIGVALYEWSKSGPPSSSSRDESADATEARNRIKEIESAGLGLQSQPSKVPESAYVNPDQLDDLYGRVSAMSVTDIKGLEQRWNSLKNALDDGLKNFQPEILKAMDGKWNGASAKSASDGIKEYVDKSAGLVGSVQLVAEKVKLVRSGIELTTANVQEAPGHTITSNIASWIPGPTWNINSHRDEQYKSAAENTVKNVFYPSVREADTGVPLVPKPYNPVYKSDDTTKKPGDDTGGSTPGKNQSKSPTTGTDPKTSNTGTENPGSTTPSTTDDTSSTSPSATNTSTTPTTTDTSTVPTSTTPTGTTPSLSSGTSGLGSSGAPSTGTPSPGKTLNLPPVVTTSGTTGTSTSSGSTGRSGMSGMGMPGSRGGGKDDEKEPKSKEYLVNQQNGEELTGLDEAHRVKAVPPVIGE
ncbi:hypothetical protein ACIHDR_18365 [Nocardia sp. NPDC052278]|uniref:hypothetical protein n=1 Tax=unclassified Nocardia TaxID=2637762 RepID=UPI0036886E5E